MLSVPQLDDLSFEKLFDRARSSIPAMTEEWTDFNAHDPGITTLQTFAWLSDTLNYYMDATGDAHRLKYFKLLGIQPEHSAAVCTVEVDSNHQEYVIPCGTRLDAAGTVFEVDKTYRGTGNRVSALYRVVDDKVLDITYLAGVDDGFAELFSYDVHQHPQLYIGFEDQLQNYIQFYAQVQENSERNTFAEGFSLVKLNWEFYDGKSWHKAELKKDETCGFLRSGFIELELNGATGVMDNPMFEEGHYLRCTLSENGYDLLPMLGKVAPCCIQAKQTRTYAQALEYRWNGSEQLPIDYYIRENDLITVALESEDGYVTWFEHYKDDRSLCKVVRGEYPWQRVICFDLEEFGAMPQPGQKILVLITSAEEYTQLVIGVTSGCAEERIDFQAYGLLDLQLAMVHKKDGRACYELWNQCEDMDRAAYDDKVFVYDPVLGQIVFGNGINGMQPPTDATVMAVTVKCSSFDNGNVMKGQLNRFVDVVQENMEIQSLEAAHGGKQFSTLEQLSEQLAQKLTKVTRAVTVADYQDIVKNTPGLMIDYVNVITAKDYAACYGGAVKQNTVMLAVKPRTHEAHPVMTEPVQRLILANLEPYRLLTTNVRLIQPKYVGVQVFGRISLQENTELSRQMVLDKLQELIEFSRTGGFGRSVAYGKVFSSLEMLECVKNVHQLSFELVGKGANKNEHGDIEVCPDGLAYVQTVDIEFL